MIKFTFLDYLQGLKKGGRWY